MWEKDQERGFGVDENIYVCTNCFDDVIKKFIKNHAAGLSCSYCKANGKESCSLDVVLEHIMHCISIEWGNPNDEGVAYESREGGWQGAVYDSLEMLSDVELEINHDDLRDEIISSLENDEWCKRDPYLLSEDKTLFYGWQAFSKFVKTEVRYMFLRATPSTYDPHQYDEINPVKILDSLSKITKNLNLVRKIKTTEKIYRVRIVGLDVTLDTVSELGAPPLKYATIPNRMSPAGISMFYGAFDSKTAIDETYDQSISGLRKAVIATFYPTRDLTLLDLSKPFLIPSIFDSEINKDRSLIKFMIEFMVDFTKKIDRDDKSHVEYVPTQIVTEYFRHIFRIDGKQLDGIMYPSSRLTDGVAVVLFANNEQCVDVARTYSKESVLCLDVTKDINSKLLGWKIMLDSYKEKLLARKLWGRIGVAALFMVMIFLTVKFINSNNFEVGTVFQDDLKMGGKAPKMVVIPAGSFQMGCVSGKECNSNEKPVHQVTIAKNFSLSQTEVTFSDYDKFAKATGRKLPKDKGRGRGNRPVINVTWFYAKAYARWLSEQTGERYRLPTEAEWEYAARAGTTTPFNTGDCIGTDQANYNGNYPLKGCNKSGFFRQKTVAVGNFQANAFGLQDMHGNVWEWTEDCWHGGYTDAPNDGRAWLEGAGAECGRRVVRGGSWNLYAMDMRSANRLRLPADGASFNIGFRIARALF